ncbi:hypothetical protein Cgig2_008245 [Carnegiea gigantea]|uniref:HMG box domain-containing protein n=1 Tax=Carnegiea gigantea TaxID=171969 RepID=A0A9Q1QTV0_9CARY|nr:hypothetical protein Cgig2_008245 [Carnegiea gigantea]
MGKQQSPKKLSHGNSSESEAKEHIEALRKKKFSIGAKKPNPLTQDLHHAVTCLSAELYTKDVHFLMELIQNAEDNEYEANVEPTLEFALTTQDITGCGAPMTLLVFNNEVGFMRQNMESICSVGRSTKKGKKRKGFIGEKGIGFKSVFLVSKHPHIVSNGYKVKFSEEPDKNCGIGYIVPEWISDESFITRIQGVYGSGILPTTTIVLPLKDDKVDPVKEELSGLHPELLLFLSKLRRLYVHKNSVGTEKRNSVTAISIASETNHVAVRDKQADSRVVHLSVKENLDAPEEKCQYYIWRQTFPVKPGATVSGRTDVEEWIVSLAFPFGKRLKRGTSSVGVFAFLPTSMVTNFPFVIQADFILASSRETIVLDSRWNRGILECIPYAFMNAFTCCVKEGSPLFTFAQAFEFLPAKPSPFSELNEVREVIQRNLIDALIMPCETFSSEVSFCKPTSAVRILPRFRELLFKMKEAGISLAAMSRMKNSLVHSSLDQDKYRSSMEFLGVHFIPGWYEKCITVCDLVSQSSDDLYVDVLHFVFCNRAEFTIKHMPLIKFINEAGKVKLSTIAETHGGQKVVFAEDAVLHAWMQKCNILFGCPNNMFVLPKSIQAALRRHPKGLIVSSWLQSYGIRPYSAAEYASQVCDYVSHKAEPKLVLSFTHFLYRSRQKKFLTDSDVFSILKSIPIIDGSGCVKVQRTETLVPAGGSKWAKLLGPLNPFLEANYVDIGEVYAAYGQFAGEHTTDPVLLNFLMVNTGARDLPEISPPNLPLQVASSQMTSEQAFLLLDWVRFHRTRGSKIPERFIESIRIGKWMKAKAGVDCPSCCTIPDEIGKSILELVKDVVLSFSIVDEDFYGDLIHSYRDELKFLGVRCGINDVQDIVKDLFIRLASFLLSRKTAVSLLLFIGFLKERKMLDEKWLNTISLGRWMLTYKGYVAAPRDTVFPQSDSEAEALLKVTSLHVIDDKFYGGKLHSFLDELKLLGIKSESEVYALAVRNLAFPDNPASLTPSCGLFLLNCLRNEESPVTSFVEKVESTPWLKTNLGFKCPSEAILYGADWGCLLRITKVPVIDEDFYGNEIRSYIDQLKAVGVGVEMENVLKIVVKELKSHLSSRVTPEHLIALLNCMSEMRGRGSSLLDDICKCLQDEEILKTRHGYRKPREAILFNSKWASISLFVDLPLVDDSYYGIKIYGFREEMKLLGALSSLEEGAIFVSRGLSGPIESALLTAESTLSLLVCLKILMANGDDHPCLGAFIENMSRSELLMTSSGYRLPQNSLLFQSAWAQMLELTDAPFISDTFYGTDMSAFLSQLKVIGVKVDLMEVCNVLSASLPLLAETSRIRRIYQFLKEVQWKPNSSGTVDLQIWIPVKEESEEGQWVNSSHCVLHLKEHYFAPVLYPLDAYYEKELLPFFSASYGVEEFPSMHHYLQIWSLWETMEAKELSDAECSFFWGYMLKNWNSETENVLTKAIAKVPATSPDKGILLASRESVFVPDNLWLKKMFMNLGDFPLFVWFPKTSAISCVPAVKFCEVYYALGVRKLSDCVRCSVSIMQPSGQQDKVDLKGKLIVKGLIEIVLGFLACKIHMPVKERHEAAKSLVSLSVFDKDENIQVSYQLYLTADRYIKAEAVKFVHWDKKSQRLFVDWSFSENPRASAEFVNFFAVEIAEGLLPHERPAVVNDLRNLIQTGFLLEFQEDAVQFLLTRENIEVPLEDDEFLSATLNVAYGKHGAGPAKRPSAEGASFSPLTPEASQSAKRRRLAEIVSTGKGGKLKAKSTYADKMSSQKKIAAKDTSDPIKPKRPLSAFFIFMEEFREQYKLEHPHMTAVAAVSMSYHLCTTVFADTGMMMLIIQEKARLIQLAEIRKAEYKKEMEAYHRKIVEAENMRVKEEPQSDVNDEENEVSSSEED